MNLGASFEVGTGAGAATVSQTPTAKGFANAKAVAGQNVSTVADSFRANWQAILDSLSGSTKETPAEETTDALPAKLDTGTSPDTAETVTPIQSASSRAVTATSLLGRTQIVKLDAARNFAVQGATSTQTVAAAATLTNVKTGKTASEKSTKSEAATTDKSTKAQQALSRSTTADPLGLIGQVSAQVSSIAPAKAVDQSLGSGGSRDPLPVADKLTTTDGEGGKAQQESGSVNTAGQAGLDAGIATAGQQAVTQTNPAPAFAEKAGSDDNEVDPVVTVSASVAQVTPAGTKGGMHTRPAAAATATSAEQRGTERTAHASEVVGSSHKDSVSQEAVATSVAQAPSTAALREASVPAGVMDRATPTLNSSHGTAGETTGNRDAFSVLDGESSAPATSWIHAGAHRAEAGYLDPTLGWVGVRAEATAGVVQAAVIPGSEAAAQTLGGHLAGLNSYLAEHHGQSATVTMDASQYGTASSGSGQGTSQGATDGGGGQQQGTDSRGTNTLAPARLSSPASQAGSASKNSFSTDRLGVSTVTGGKHISVLA